MHIPVLLKEAVKSLSINQGDIIIDATLGDGGHSREILENLKNGKLIAIDVDQKAIEKCKKDLQKIAEKNSNEIFFIKDNFANLDHILKRLGIGKINGVLADLGWRIEQVEDKEYGMSFKKDGLLDMRLDRESEGQSAVEIVNNYKEKELTDIFREYGEERFSKQVAKAIIKKRKFKKITTTSELAGLIEESIGRYYRKSRIHPATKIFQSLRIEVNSEIDNLEIFLEKALAYLEKGGRLAVISFHSLEDRKVKKFFQVNARGCICPKGSPVCFCGKEVELKKITGKPIISSEKECKDNPGSRSARLRVAEKT